MQKNAKYIGIILLFLTITNSVFSQLTVTNPVTNAQVISSLGGAGVTISNLTINCPGNAYGTFNGASTNIGIAQGLLMTTGDATNAIGPNLVGSQGTSNLTSYSDPDLLALEPLADNDVCIIEFDIVPSCNQLNLNYVFGSEEYPEFVCANYDDVFGFFISGPNPAGGTYASKNIAIIPNTNIPVAINSINPGVNTGGGSCISLNYSQYYVNNTNGTTIEYDGFTVPLTATVNVVPCVSYHMKLGIADAGDNSYDSGVFLNYQGLYCPFVPLTVSPTRNICAGQTTSLTANGATSYTWTPTTGLTFINDSTVSASPNVTTTYTVTGNNQSGCGIGQGIIIVNVGQLDPPSFNITDATCVCDGRAEVIPAAPPGGGTAPFTYQWSDGQTTSEAINLCPGQYSVILTDNFGCSANSQVTVNVTGGPVSTVSTQNVLCNGNSTGSAVVTPTSGTPPYSYSWSNGDQDSVATGLPAGLYEVFITDINGCQTLDTAIVTEPPILVLNPVQSNVTCKGASNGSAIAQVSGGVGPYLYSWSNGASTGVNANIPAGFYVVTVTDINGCSLTQNYTITEPALGITVTTDVDSVSCNGGSDGMATAQAVGGTGSYTYSWVPTGDTTAISDSLAAGMYMVIVSDSLGCQTRDTITIEEPTAITLNFFVQSTLCYGSSDGAVLVQASGGQPGYTYLWENGSTITQLTGLSSDHYSVTVTDTTGCIRTDSAFVPQPTPLSLAVTTTSSTCSSTSNGSAQVTATGGTPGFQGYTYSWNTGNTTQNMVGIGMGMYIATVTDSNNCQAQDTAFVGSQGSIVVSFTDQDPSCAGLTDGWIKASVSGGIAPYGYSWSTGATTDSIFALGGGTYSLTVSDSGSASPTVVYQEDFDGDMNWLLNVPTGANTFSSNVWYHGTGASSASGSCGTPGIADSTLYVGMNGNASAGAVYDSSVVTHSSVVSPWISTAGYGGPLTLSYEFMGASNAADKSSVDISVDGGQSWINLRTSDTTDTCGLTRSWQMRSYVLPTVAENNARLQVRFVWINDNDTLKENTSVAINNLTLTAPRQGAMCMVTTQNTLVEPAAVTIGVTSQQPAICANNIGSITVQGQGGTGTYTYSWSTTPSQLSSTATGLLANTPYQVTVTDQNGCMKDTVLQVTQLNPSIQVSLNAQNAICLSSNGSITATVISTGTTAPYTYLWTPTGQTSSMATGLTGGQQYQLTVRDVNGCQLDTVVRMSTTNMELGLTRSATQNTCGHDDGTATVGATLGTGPYTYAWDAAAGSQTTATANGLAGGFYNVVVTDANGCTSDTTVFVPEVLGVEALFTPSTITGVSPTTVTFTNSSTGASNYLWEFGNGQSSTLDVPPGVEYQAGEFVVVLHAYYGSSNQCEDTATVVIKILDELELYIPNVFAPGSAKNGTFKVTAQGIKTFSMKIFDRWGTKVIELTDPSQEWDGAGQHAGTYYYVLDYTPNGNDTGILNKTGFIQLVK